MLTKLAEYVLNQHQQRVLDRLDKAPGVVAFHSLGSGKTLTALDAAKRELERNKEGKALFVVPASLVSNVYKEVDNHGVPIDKDRLNVISYEKAVRSVDDLMKDKYALVVADEAHRLRNSGTKRSEALQQILSAADKRLLLTGTLSYNKLNDAAKLVNLAANERVLPENEKDFYGRYVGTKVVNPTFFQKLKGVTPGEVQVLQNEKELGSVLNKYVDRYDSTENMQKFFPRSLDKNVEVPMDNEQLKYYNFVMGDMSKGVQEKIKAGIPLSKQELKEFNTFATGVRQVSNSVSPYVGKPTLSPKIQAAVKSMAESAKSTPGFRGVAYSNYLDAALVPYKQHLEEQGINADLFTGSLTAKEKKALVDAYNDIENKDPRVLLISSSGAEGLDLKGTRKLQVLEPHFNPAKTDQVVGRGVRYKSHEHLPEDQRQVEVERYLSTYPKSLTNKLFGTKPQTAIDQYLFDRSEEKAELSNQMAALFR